MRNYLRLGHVVVRFGEEQQVPAFEEKLMEHFSEARRVEVVTTGFTLVPQLVVGTTRVATVHRRLAQFYAKQSPLEILKPPVEIGPVVESMSGTRFETAIPASGGFAGFYTRLVPNTRSANVIFWAVA